MKDITKGKWKFKKYIGGEERAKELRKHGLEPTLSVTNDGDVIVTSPNGPIAHVMLKRDDVKRNQAHLSEDQERDANATLIAQVGTVHNESGFTPRELLEQRDKLLWLLKQIITDLPANRDWLNPDIEADARALIERNVL